jgi:hypothetical protein
MAIPSRQIGWGTEDNLLWQISKQLERLTQVTGNSIVPTTTTTTTLPVYQVFTALLTQSGGDNPLAQDSGNLIIGVTYQFTNPSDGIDFSNVGAPNNNSGTYFVATGTTPNSWGAAEGLGDSLVNYNTGAPVATVLENTIGDVWFSYVDIGSYNVHSLNLFTLNKTLCSSEIISGIFSSVYNPIINTEDYVNIEVVVLGIGYQNSLLNNTPIEIRVYN